MLAMMGKQKAAVFPDPVWAQAMRSRPCRQMGMEYRCTGVGLVYLHRFTLPPRLGPKSTCTCHHHCWVQPPCYVAHKRGVATFFLEAIEQVSQQLSLRLHSCIISVLPQQHPGHVWTASPADYRCVGVHESKVLARLVEECVKADQAWGVVDCCR